MSGDKRWGWGWIEGEDESDGDRWIQISALDSEDCLEEEVAVLMVRDYARAVEESPGIVEDRQRKAQHIVDALNACETRAAAKTKVVLNVHGGEIQEVFCSAPATDLILVDWDTEGCDLSEKGIVQISTEDGSRPLAFVRQQEVSPLWAVAGRDIESALEKAGIAEELLGCTKTEVRRYVLYDFDMGDLATTHVYDGYQEAADDASQLNNVIVAPLEFEELPAGRGPQEADP